jgi:hypothetical protein
MVTLNLSPSHPLTPGLALILENSNRFFENSLELFEISSCFDLGSALAYLRIFDP